MRLILTRLEAKIRDAHALFLLASAACRGVLRPEWEGRRQRRKSEGGLPFGSLRLLWSRSDAADGGARQQGHHGSRRSCWIARLYVPACLMNP
jgi:hypothetical protein